MLVAAVRSDLPFLQLIFTFSLPSARYRYHISAVYCAKYTRTVDWLTSDTSLTEKPSLLMSRKENALDLAKFIDKGVRVKLSGGREGATVSAF